MKKDFSIRNEVEVMLTEKLEMEMTSQQIDDVVEAIELHETFLSTVGLFVAKGIKEIAEKEKMTVDDERLDYQINKNREFINYKDL